MVNNDADVATPIPRRKHSICLVQPTAFAISETFIRDHAVHLPANVTVVHGGHPGQQAAIAGQPVLSQSVLARMQRKVGRVLCRNNWDWEITAGYLAAFRRSNADAVLVEYGNAGIHLVEPCRIAGIPLIVHFHGYDASRRDVLSQHNADYCRMFQHAAAIVAVSKAMRSRLLELGAPTERLHLSPYGVDCSHFGGANPRDAGPTALAVGRFVEKKAPHLTILAFAEVLKQFPEAKLRMIGTGPLWGACRDLIGALGLQGAVTLLGAQPHETVMQEMRQARCFVQHSVEASDGDCEGTPVAVLEAGASGLPVVATRHAGIPDVVIEGCTGLLVEERDVNGMARHLINVLSSSNFAGNIGTAAREHIATNFTMEQSIGRLWSIIEACIANRRSKAATDSAGNCQSGIFTPAPVSGK